LNEKRRRGKMKIAKSSPNSRPKTGTWVTKILFEMRVLLVEEGSALAVIDHIL
jgi:hypothetical protein